MPKVFSSKDFHVDTEKMTCRCPAGKSLWLNCKNIESNGKRYIRFAGHLKDCKTCTLQRQCMQKPPQEIGRQVQFLISSVNQPSYTDKMRVKIDSSIGRRQYSKRLGMIEPVFGNITVNKGMNKFTLRGKDKVNAQWQMYCLVHNIEKLRNSLHWKLVEHNPALKPSSERSVSSNPPQIILSPVSDLMIERLNNLNYGLHILKF